PLSSASGARTTQSGLHSHEAEFDEGPAELRRMVDGGCRPEDGCAPDAPYPGADIACLSTNVIERGSKAPLLKPYTVKTLPNGQRIGFIGPVAKEAPGAINAYECSARRPRVPRRWRRHVRGRLPGPARNPAARAPDHRRPMVRCTCGRLA
ncbi:hypothetical protein ABZY11_15200, partial [Streptomyces sp. NPDC006510]